MAEETDVAAVAQQTGMLSNTAPSLMLLRLTSTITFPLSVT